MARQEATNTFTEGLVSDLHPLNTPNTVLTDCLNGTLITYNGNEFVLQNDMGNYELKNCKLKPNFIPVGIKSYADILYIVSYNPITKQTEIGSYPSPQSRFWLTDEQTGKEITSNNIDYYIINNEKNYTDVLEEQPKNLFVYIDSDDEDALKLYPGDEFSIIKNEDASTSNMFIWQTLDFYVIDENKKQYDIDDNQLIYSGNTESSVRNKVFWEVPGWLAMKWRLLVPQRFILNIVNLNIPNFFDTNTNDKISNVSISLNTQLTVEDKQFQEIYKTNKDVYVKYEILINSSQETSPQSIKLASHNYSDDILTLYNNFKYEFVNPLSKDDIIIIKATPGVKSNSNTLWYDQFTAEYSFTLNSVKDSSEIEIGNTVYKWTSDSNSCTITFNVNGPFINSDGISCKYKISRWNPEQNILNLIEQEKWESIDTIGDEYLTPVNFGTSENVITDQQIDNFIPYGENIIDVDFKDLFQLEGGLYDLEIKIYELVDGTQTLTDDIEAKTTKHLLLIPTVTLNEFYTTVDNFMTEIQGQQWISKFIDNVDLTQCDVYNWNNLPEDKVQNPDVMNSLTGNFYDNNGNYLTNKPADNNEGYNLLNAWENVEFDAEYIKTNPTPLINSIEGDHIFNSQTNINPVNFVYETNQYGFEVDVNDEINYLGKNLETSLWWAKDADITWIFKNGNDEVFYKTYNLQDENPHMYISDENGINYVFPNLFFNYELQYNWQEVEKSVEGNKHFLFNDSTINIITKASDSGKIDAKLDISVGSTLENLRKNDNIPLNDPKSLRIANSVLNAITSDKAVMKGHIRNSGGSIQGVEPVITRSTDTGYTNATLFIAAGQPKEGLFLRAYNPSVDGQAQLVFVPKPSGSSKEVDTFWDEELPKLVYIEPNTAAGTAFMLNLGSLTDSNKTNFTINRLTIEYKITKDSLTYGDNKLNQSWTLFNQLYKNNCILMPNEEFVMKLATSLKNKQLISSASLNVKLRGSDKYSMFKNKLIEFIEKWNAINNEQSINNVEFQFDGISKDKRTSYGNALLTRLKINNKVSFDAKTIKFDNGQNTAVLIQHRNGEPNNPITRSGYFWICFVQDINS